MEREEIRERVTAALTGKEDRLALRGHALYCAAVYLNGQPNSTGKFVTEVADRFVEWLEAEPGPDTGGTRT